ncbi:protein of unknown function [Salinimicrobium catena]|uniref:HTH cro/C1-type domain-containing protein n=1 Tax=Salinimicrobium catena TaxID=390640 RepID=A0A1H5MYA8_9FLAO|nr:helix-turn-helix domain-containing protein [Salinimicrobium catena]SDL31387.1 protein of unknown function [Salinimicrobium catena]SEE93717.1 protein of unknown function [Salinimicrobium catena]
MSGLVEIREKRNLTQKELAERSGISIRTIQRIEAGTAPKGFTLKTLAEALSVSEEELLGTKKRSRAFDKKALQMINLSSLLFFIPFGNIFFPLLLIKIKKQQNAIAKQLVNIQILWTVSMIVVVGISPFWVRWVGASRQLSLQLLLIFCLLNLFIILRNAVALAKHDRLYFRLNFSFL